MNQVIPAFDNTASANNTKNIPATKITSQADLKMISLMKFYSKPYNRNQMIPILEGTSPIALRHIDWFLTNYSKQYDVMYDIKKGDQIRHFDVYQNYKAKIRGDKKKLFDPFCRRGKIDFEYDEGKVIETSVAQLNCFKWVIENKILDYMSNNLEHIIEDMNIRGSKAKKEGSKKAPKKALSINAAKTITRHDVTVTVSFS